MTARLTTSTASGPDTVPTEPVTVTTHADGTITATCRECHAFCSGPAEYVDVRWFMSRHSEPHTGSPSVAAGRKKR